MKHDLSYCFRARIDARLKKALDDLSRSRGIVMNHFIQEALPYRMEELEDVEDVGSRAQC